MKYTCYRCFYTIDKKSSFINHINRKKICLRNIESFKYSQEEIKELEELQLNNKNKTEIKCNICNKIFSENFNLNKHLKIHEKENNSIDDSILDNNNLNNNVFIGNNNLIYNKTEIQNITNITNITNIINFSPPVPFDKGWDLSKIDELNICKLLFSNFMYTKLLEEILKNETNLNVIIRQNENDGLVYKNDDEKYVNMDVKDIVKESMEKLNKHLLDLNDKLDTNIIDVYKTNIKNLIDKKMKDFKDGVVDGIDLEKCVNDKIKKRYDEVHEKAIEICNKVNENKNENKIIEY